MLRAEAAALRALELDDSIAEAYAALAEVRIYREWNLEGAEQAFKRALDLNPNLAHARGHYSWYLMFHEGLDATLAEAERARALDPLHPVFPAWIGWQLWFAGRLEEARDDPRFQDLVRRVNAPG